MMMQFKIMKNIFNKKHKRNKTRNTVEFHRLQKEFTKIFTSFIYIQETCFSTMWYRQTLMAS